MNITGKNLLDDKEIINNYIEYLNDNNENIVSVEINQYTKDYLEEKGIYKIANALYIINNNLSNFEIKFNRQKKIKTTEYVSYEVKDEIKEIFRRMNDLIEHQFDKEYHTECNLFGDIQRLLDYITNLEQKYERMKENANILSKGYDELYSRIDKAIEYIEKRNFNEVEIVNEPFNDDFDFKENILNILTGGDEE